jgi:hypothetical protein
VSSQLDSIPSSTSGLLLLLLLLASAAAAAGTAAGVLLAWLLLHVRMRLERTDETLKHTHWAALLLKRMAAAGQAISDFCCCCLAVAGLMQELLGQVDVVSGLSMQQ